MRSRWTWIALGVAALIAVLAIWLSGRGGPPAVEAAAPAPEDEAQAPGARPEHQRIRAPVQLMPASAKADEAATSGAFEGRVVAADTGRGIPNAELTFSFGDSASSVRSGADGRFELRAPRPGRYELAAVVAEGYLPFAPEWGHSPVSLTAEPGRRIGGVVVFLWPAVQYEGKVVDPDGKRVAGAEVRVLSAGGERALMPLPERFTSGPDGSFTFRAGDDALLEATKEGFTPGRALLDSRARAARSVVIRLGAAGEQVPEAMQISGHVLEPGRLAAEGALVEATFMRPDGAERYSYELHPSAQAMADGDGRFVLAGLDPGQYLVTATKGDLAPARRYGIAAGTAELELKLDTGSRLVGRVVEGRSRKPVQSFTVEVSSVHGMRRTSVATRAFADPDGRFELPGLPEGTHEVQVAAYGYAPSKARQVEIRLPAEPPAEVELALDRGGRVFGSVVDRVTRKPLPGAQISAEGRMEGATSALPVLAFAAADEAGKFELWGLAEGLSSIVISEPRHHTRILSGLRVENDGSIGPLAVDLTPADPGETPRIELVGIGAVLTAVEDTLRVVRVLPGGGAAEVNLAEGDVVLAIDGQPVKLVGFEGAIQQIRGPEGSYVLLRVRRAADGQEVDFRVPRRRVLG